MTHHHRIPRDIQSYVTNLGNDKIPCDQPFQFKEVAIQVDGVPSDTAFLANVTATGARLLNATNISIPVIFELLGMDQQGKAIQCEVIWRRESEIGIRFINAVDLSDWHSASWAA
jgi:hypothetical protein